MSKYKVLISATHLHPVLDRFLGVFRDEGIEIIVPKVNERLSEAELLPLVKDIDGAICGDDRFSRRVMESAPRLKVISKWGTGIDSIDREAAAALGIRVANVPNAFTLPVADTALSFMLCFARGTVTSDRLMKSGRWEKVAGFTLSECTLGIIGLGNIGRAVARRALAFGMTVIANDIKDVPSDFLAETHIQMVTKDELLTRSDFVSLNCDLNPTSTHLLGEKQFARMKPTAYVVNTARGPIIDEPALIRALQNKQIAGAGLDVFENEPLPADSPLLGMNNVLLAAHNSNTSPAAKERVHHRSVQNLISGLKEVRR